MARKEKTYLEEAASSRRFAKGLRIYGLALYVLAVVAAALVVWMFADGHTTNGVMTSVSTLVIAFWGWFARHVQAQASEDNAKSWESLEVKYGYLHR